jgi:poly(A) polymerase
MQAAAHVELHATPASQAAVEVVRRLREAGHSAYLVGGCVRDLVLGLVPKDYDVATAATPDQVRALFRNIVEVGAVFGVLRVRLAPAAGLAVQEIEVATFRAEAAYTDGRRPDVVRFTDAREDVVRRDFTMNGLLLDPLDSSGQPAELGVVVDLVEGMPDLLARRLRAIGSPFERFEEDALRLLRAPRFASRFRMVIDPATAQAIRAAAPTLQRVSAERISAECAAMLTGEHVDLALDLMVDLGLAAVIWPLVLAADPDLGRAKARFASARRELELQPATAPNAFAPETTLRLPLALALLFADARPVARELGRAWRLSHADIQELSKIQELVDGLRTRAEAAERPLSAALVRLLREPMSDAALLVLLAATDLDGDGQGTVHVCRELRRLRAMTQRSVWWPELAVTGDTLQAWGHSPGPGFRSVLQAAEDVQLRGGDAETARAEARRRLGNETA